MADWLTHAYSNNRDGGQPDETALTATAVRARGVALSGTLQLADDARGADGQVLVVGAQLMEDGLTHEVAYVSTMANDVYAFDLGTAGYPLLWKQHLGRPIASDTALDMWNVADNWGILSTGVVDPAAGLLYVCAMTSVTGLIADSGFYLRALSLVDGHDVKPPLSLGSASYRGSVLGSVARKQRVALTLDVRGGVSTVFVGFGSFLEDASTNQGWCVAADVGAATMSVAAAWTSVVGGEGAGIWMAGGGFSVTTDGDLLAMTANGDFDGIDCFGESFVRLRYTPASSTGPASIACIDWFTPYTDTGRAGYDPTTKALSSVQARPPVVSANTSNAHDAYDQDLGSGAPLYLPAAMTGYAHDGIVGGGKDGLAYSLDASVMGKTELASFAPASIAAGVYGALKAPVVGYSYYPGGTDLQPTDLSTLPPLYGGVTHHIHGQPVAFVSLDHGVVTYVGGENGPVRAFTYRPDGSLAYLATGSDVASASVPPPGGMPGSMLTLAYSAADLGDAILVALQPLGDANRTVTGGRMVVYAASWVTDGQLTKLWDSDDWGIRFMHAKFNRATVANGKILVPSYDGRVLVFTLTGDAPMIRIAATFLSACLVDQYVDLQRVTPLIVLVLVISIVLRLITLDIRDDYDPADSLL